MTILSFQTETIGQSGQVPKFIYLQTNNTVAEVEAAGFLDGLINDGVPISDTMMALVSTKLTPSAKASQTGLYTISNGVLTLVTSGPSSSAWDVGGNVTGAPAVFGTIDSENVSLQAGGFTFIEFVPGSTTMDLDAAFLSIDVSDTAQFSATTLFTLDSTTEIRVGGAFAPLVILGNSTATHEVNIVSPVVHMANLASSTQNRLLYLDNATGLVTKGPVPAIVDAWLIGGNTAAPSGVFGTLDAVDLHMQTGGVDFMSVTAAGNVLIHAPGTLIVESGSGQQTFGSFAGVTGLYGTSVDSYAQGGNASFDCDGVFTIGGLGATTINIGAVATAMTIANAATVTVFDATDLSMPNMPTATGGEKIVMIDVATGQLRVSP